MQQLGAQSFRQRWSWKELSRSSRSRDSTGAAVHRRVQLSLTHSSVIRQDSLGTEYGVDLTGSVGRSNGTATASSARQRRRRTEFPPSHDADASCRRRPAFARAAGACRRALGVDLGETGGTNALPRCRPSPRHAARRTDPLHLSGAVAGFRANCTYGYRMLMLVPFPWIGRWDGLGALF
jgi:hypothetical protein